MVGLRNPTATQRCCFVRVALHNVRVGLFPCESFYKKMLTASDLQNRNFVPIFEEGDGFMMLFELRLNAPPPLESPSPVVVRRRRRRTRSSWVIPTPALTPPRRRPKRVVVPDLPLTSTFPVQVLLNEEMVRSLMDQTCRICLFEYEVNDEVVRLPCLHIYHKQCLEPLLKQNPCCPQDQMRLEEYL